MDLALYHPEHGYYAAREQRSGRRGDFYTSVDVGPMFGELLAAQFAEMASTLPGPFDLVEAAAGNGRLTRDVLDALQRDVAGRVLARARAPGGTERAGAVGPAGDARTARRQARVVNERAAGSRSNGICSPTSCSTRSRSTWSSCGRRGRARSTSTSGTDRSLNAKRRSRRDGVGKNWKCGADARPRHADGDQSRGA